MTDYNSQSPTDPAETLGESETRVAQTVANDIHAHIGPLDPSALPVVTEAQALMDADPTFEAKLGEAIDLASDQERTALIDDDGDDFPVL